MSSLTFRLPDEKHQRLKALAKIRGMSLNRLFDEMTTMMLVEFDTETRFRICAERGAGKEARGLELLDKAKSAARADMAAFDAFLDAVPDVPPVPVDEIKSVE